MTQSVRDEVFITLYSVKIMSGRSGRSLTGYETISPSISVEGQILAADGSAAAPSMAFISDEKTGIYRNGSTLVSSISGTGVMTTSSSGVSVSGTMTSTQVSALGGASSLSA